MAIKAEEALDGCLATLGKALVAVARDGPPAWRGRLCEKFCAHPVGVRLQYKRRGLKRDWQKQCDFLRTKGVPIATESYDVDCRQWAIWEVEVVNET